MCCDDFYKAIEIGYIHRNEKGNYEIIKDFLDDECDWTEIKHCPFCGKKLND